MKLYQKNSWFFDSAPKKLISSLYSLSRNQTQKLELSNEKGQN